MAFPVLLFVWTTFGGQNKIRVETPTTNAIIDGQMISFDNGLSYDPYTYNGLGTKNDGPSPRPSGEFITVNGQRYVYDANNPTNALPLGNWNIRISDLDSSTPPCFVAGTLILTPDGERLIEELEEGDEVVTVSGRSRRILWTEGRHIPVFAFERDPELRPIRIAAGAIGNSRDLIVSPQHKVLLTGAYVEIYFGETEVLAPAKGLLSGDRIHYCDVDSGVIYHHILLEQHDVLWANGVPAESLYLGNQMSEPVLRELSVLLPQFDRFRSEQSFSHPVLSVREARILAMHALVQHCPSSAKSFDGVCT